MGTKVQPTLLPGYQSAVTTLNISGTVYALNWDAHLDKLARSSDPYLKVKLKKRIEQVLAGGGQSFNYTLPTHELSALGRVYGEQLADDPWADLEAYFDVLNGRFYTRPIPTQLAILYLFGTDKPYRANLGTLSVAGEAVAGYVLERLGYHALVRPIGIMPDALMWTTRDREFRLALCEAKASVDSNSPKKMILDEAYDFMVDIKTRRDSFSSNHYEAYLTCSVFRDGGDVEVACLYVDLGGYKTPTFVGQDVMPLEQTPPTREVRGDPWSRLDDILRVQAATSHARDEYLAGLLSEEAMRTATVALFREKRPPSGVADVDCYIQERARSAGVDREWMQTQEITRGTKEREDETLKAALRRYRSVDFDRDK